MKSHPGPVGATVLRTRLLLNHHSVVVSSCSDLAIAKRHHKTSTAQITLSEHQADIEKLEERWYQCIREVEMNAKDQVDKLYLQMGNYSAENSRLHVI